jgi:hypothetical protein
VGYFKIRPLLWQVEAVSCPHLCDGSFGWRQQAAEACGWGEVGIVVNEWGREQLCRRVEGKFWSFDGGDWLLISDKAELDVLIDQSNATAADLECLSWGWRGLELVWL